MDTNDLLDMHALRTGSREFSINIREIIYAKVTLVLASHDLDDWFWHDNGFVIVLHVNTLQHARPLRSESY